MAVTLVGSATVTGFNSGTTSGFDTTGATLLIIHVSYLASIPPTVSDSKGNTWNGLTISSTIVSNADRLYYAENPTVGTGHTFSFTGTGSATCLVGAAFSGIRTTSPFDAEGPGSVGGTFATGQAPGPLTTSSANELVVTGFSWGNNSSIATINDSFTVVSSTDFVGGVNYGDAFGYRVVVSDSTLVDPSWGNGGTGRRTATLAGFISSDAVSQAVSDTNTISEDPVIGRGYLFSEGISLSESAVPEVTGAVPSGDLVTSFLSLTDSATTSFGVASPPHRGNIDYDQIRVAARSGDGAKFHTLTGSLVPGNTIVSDAAGNLIDAGVTPGGGSGTVTSVAQSVPTSLLAITGSPVTTSGTLALSLVDQDANKVFAGPASGADAAPTFRAIVEADLPLGSSSAFGAVKVDNTTITAAAGVISAAQPTTNVLYPGVPASGTIPDVSGWTVVNSAVLTSQTGGAGYPALIKIAGNASLNWRALKTTLPSAPYRVIVRLNGNRGFINSSNFGIYFFDNANKYAGIEVLYQNTAGTPVVRIQKGTGPTNSASSTPSGYGFGDGNGYLAIAQDTSSVNQIYSYSPDGVNWITLLSEATGTYVTPTGYGIGGLLQVASVDAYVSLTYYRLTV